MPARRPALATSLAPVLLTMFLAAAAAPASAQTSATAAWRATPASLLKGTLRGVVTAQSRHRAARGAYATSLAPLGMRLEPGVRVDILAAGPTGCSSACTSCS